MMFAQRVMTQDRSPSRGATSIGARLLGTLALASALLGQSPADAKDHAWITTWMASPQPIWGSDFAFPTKIPASVQAETIRQIVQISLGGSRVRIVFSNVYGETPLTIGAGSIALAAQGPATVPGTTRALAFGGKNNIVIPPGASAISDPIDLTVRSQAQLAVSLYLPERTPLTTFHWDGRQTAYFGQGDLSQTTDFATVRTTDARVFLSDVIVETPNEGSVVVLGDSITDGNGAAVDADVRWPDFLARRLTPHFVAVLNAGISGARLLQDKMGVNAAARLDRDVFAQPNVKALIVLIGINDISWPGTAFARDQTAPSVEALIAGYRQLIASAHAHNIRIIGATLPPFEGALNGTPLGDYYNPSKDALRQEINRWIRTSDGFDAVIDFDAVLRDPAHPSRLAPAFDSGDHLHPGDKGNQAMADAVDIRTLLGQ